MSDRELVDMMESVWTSITDLCATFDESQWKSPTDCPGWSVQDQLSHLAGSESMYLGRPSPDHTARDTSHVKNEIGERNEVVVDWRRPWTGARVLDEFRELTAERMRTLRAFGPDEFAAQTQTPIGPGAMRDLIAIRIFDAWVHEQDIRRAVGVAGNLDGPVAQHSMGRVTSAMPFVVGKKAQAPDGATVVFDVTGPTGVTLSIGVEGGRAKTLDAAPAQPTVHLTMDLETFACLGCGRWDSAETLASGKVRFDGDRTLGKAIVSQMNFMP